MRTIEAIRKEIQEEEKFAATPNATKRQMEKSAKRIENLRACILYLETNPTEQFMNKQLTQLKKNVDVINSGFGAWRRNNPKDAEVSNPKSKYETMMGMKTIKAQIKNLNYLLA